MANQDAPFGFRAVGGMGSSYETQGTSKYQIQDHYGGAIYQGDMCQTETGQAGGGGSTSVTGYIDASAVGQLNNIGAFNGCFYNDPTAQKPTWKNYYPGSINITQGTIDAFVYDNPQQLYEVQGSTGAVIAQADMGNLVELGTYAAGSTVNGHSKEEISNATLTTTAMFRLLRISEDPSNSDISVAHANWIVRLNESIYYNRGTKITT